MRTYRMLHGTFAGLDMEPGLYHINRVGHDYKFAWIVLGLDRRIYVMKTRRLARRKWRQLKRERPAP